MPDDTSRNGPPRETPVDPQPAAVVPSILALWFLGLLPAFVHVLLFMQYLDDATMPLSLDAFLWILPCVVVPLLAMLGWLVPVRLPGKAGPIVKWGSLVVLLLVNAAVWAASFLLLLMAPTSAMH